MNLESDIDCLSLKLSTIRGESSLAWLDLMTLKKLSSKTPQFLSLIFDFYPTLNISSEELLGSYEVGISLVTGSAKVLRLTQFP